MVQGLVVNHYSRMVVLPGLHHEVLSVDGREKVLGCGGGYLILPILRRFPSQHEEAGAARFFETEGVRDFPPFQRLPAWFAPEPNMLQHFAVYRVGVGDQPGLAGCFFHSSPCLQIYVQGRIYDGSDTREGEQGRFTYAK